MGAQCPIPTTISLCHPAPGDEQSTCHSPPGYQHISYQASRVSSEIWRSNSCSDASAAPLIQRFGRSRVPAALNLNRDAAPLHYHMLYLDGVYDKKGTLTMRLVVPLTNNMNLSRSVSRPPARALLQGDQCLAYRAYPKVEVVCAHPSLPLYYRDHGYIAQPRTEVYWRTEP